MRVVLEIGGITEVSDFGGYEQMAFIKCPWNPVSSISFCLGPLISQQYIVSSENHKPQSSKWSLHHLKLLL